MDEQIPDIPGYTTLGLIGSGSSSQVWQTRDASGQIYAAKVFNERGAEHGAIEWEALRRYRGEHILDVIDWVLCPSGHRALITEYASGGSLQDVVQGRGGLTSGECVTALAPIAGVLIGIHEDGFVHGDLTPNNIMFDANGKPLLGDLGAARPIAQSGAPEWGSAGFISPELLEGEPPTSSADVFALGACAWFALTGEAPQPPVIRPRLQDVVPDVASALAEFIHAALVVSPGARPSMQQAHDQLLGATHSAVVPLSTAQGQQENASMTIRLREEAARRQQRRPVHPAARVSASKKSRGLAQTPKGSGKVKGAVVSGVALAALAMTVPLGRSATQHTYLAADAMHHTTLAPKTASPVQGEVSPLTAQEVTRLLTCRARLWRNLPDATPAACMAPGSPAMNTESLALAQAKKAKIRYDGLTFAVVGTPLITVKGPTSAQVVATVTRSAYVVHGSAISSHVASHQQRVAMTFIHQKGQWLMTSWRGA